MVLYYLVRVYISNRYIDSPYYVNRLFVQSFLFISLEMEEPLLDKEENAMDAFGVLDFIIREYLFIFLVFRCESRNVGV